MPRKYQDNLEKCKSINVGREFRVWDEQQLRRDVLQDERYQKYAVIFDKHAEILHMKIDFAKLLILHKYAGIYVDMDMVCLKPMAQFDRMMKSGTELMVSRYPVGGFEVRLITMGRHSQLFNNGFYYVLIPRSLVIQRLIDEAVSRLRGRILPSNYMTVFYTVGPAMHTDVLMKNLHRVTIIPHYVVEPCNALDKKCTPGSESIMWHQFDKTWFPEGVKNTAEFLGTNTTKENCIGGVLIFILVVFIIYKCSQKKI